jgi:superfamily II DNA or RNA helicase
MVLGNKGLIVDYDALKKYLGVKATKTLLSDITLTKKKFAGRNKTIVLTSKIYKFIKVPKDGKVITLLTLPRFFQEWTEEFPFQLTIRHPEFETIPAEKFLDKNGEQTIKLLDYQQAIHDHLISTVYRPDSTDPQECLERGAVLVLDTGRGKTYTAGGIIRTLGVKTLVIAHNSRGLEEWEKMLRKYPNITVGYYCTGKRVDGDVVIMVINSAMRSNFDFTPKKKRNEPTPDKIVLSRDKYFKQFGFVIYDEIPEYLSEKRRALFWDTNFKYSLGLTATPEENLNDWDPIYQMQVGPLIYAEDVPGFNVDDVEWDFTVRAINYYGPPEFTEQKVSETTGMTVCAWMAEQFIQDPYRNKMILDIIQEYYDDGHCIFVFGEKRSVLTDFAKKIQETLGLDPLVPEDKAQIKDIMGGSSSADVQSAVDNSRIILTTYQYGSKGMSIGKMTRGIQLTPRRHGMKQVTGRLTRADGDVTIPRVWVDVRDCNTSLASQKRNRNADYKEKGFAIEEEKIAYEDISI